MSELFLRWPFPWCPARSRSGLKEKRKLTVKKSVAGSFKGLEINFLDGYGHWMRIQANHPHQSTFETKVYPHPYVNKSTTALFRVFGIYANYRKR
jgi:hypothetical protein